MKNTKGIILAGGLGSRLYPLSKIVSKHILPIYNKPMIFYSLSTLMLSGLKDILIITKPDDLKSYQNLLGDGSSYGIKLSYAIQEKPKGIAQALLVGQDYLKKSNCLIILGDNFFYGNKLFPIIKKVLGSKKSIIFSYYVKNPSEFGIIKYDKNKNIEGIYEKPKKYISNYAISGLYYYPVGVTDLVKKLKISKRKELEITDLNRIYLKKKKLKCINLGRGITWLDTGTYEDMLNASQFVKIVELRQGTMIGCLEEIALNNKWIDKINLAKNIKKYQNSDYKNNLIKLLKNN